MNLATMAKQFASKLNQTTASLMGELTKFRAAIVALRTRLQHVESAPLPVEEIVAEVIPAVVREHGSYWIQQNGDALIRGNRSLGSPNVVGSRELPWSPLDPLPWGVLCAADPAGAEKFLAALVRRIEYEAGPPSADRPALIAKLQTELAEQEAAEEALIDEAAEAGVVIQHRPEVIQRRQNAARKAELDTREAADRRAREATINARHENAGGRRRPAASPYLAAQNAGRQELREG